MKWVKRYVGFPTGLWMVVVVDLVQQDEGVRRSMAAAVCVSLLLAWVGWREYLSPTFYDEEIERRCEGIDTSTERVEAMIKTVRRKR